METSIRIINTQDLEESTGIPAEGVWFEVIGDVEAAREWLESDWQWDKHARQPASLTIDRDAKLGNFAELNAWDDWKKGSEHKCDYS